MNRITPQPGIMEIALYQGGASQIEGDHGRAKELVVFDLPFGKNLGPVEKQIHRGCREIDFDASGKHRDSSSPRHGFSNGPFEAASGLL